MREASLDGALRFGHVTRLGRAGHENVQATRDGRPEELRGLRGQRPQFDEVLEPLRTGDELPDVDGPVPARAVRITTCSRDPVVIYP